MKTRAILIASHHAWAESSRRVLPGCLDLLVDRPFVQHVVEQLARAGIEEIDVLVGSGAREMEAQLGTGERWGLTIRHHVARNESSVYDALAHVPDLVSCEDALLAHADALVHPRCWRSPVSGHPPLVLLHHVRRTEDGPVRLWTGWCRTSGPILAAIGRVSSRQELLGALTAAAGTAVTRMSEALLVGDGDELLEANRRVMSGCAPFVSLRGRCHPGRIWKERGVRVHETATLRGPVYLGEHVEVGAGTTLGPNVVVGAGSIVDSGAQIRDSLIGTATYVRPGAWCETVLGLESRGACRPGGEALPRPAADALVDIRKLSIRAEVYPVVERLIAVALVVLAAPAWLLMAAVTRLRHAGMLHRTGGLAAPPSRADDHGARPRLPEVDLLEGLAVSAGRAAGLTGRLLARTIARFFTRARDLQPPGMVGVACEEN